MTIETLEGYLSWNILNREVTPYAKSSAESRPGIARHHSAEQCTQAGTVAGVHCTLLGRFQGAQNGA
jgi:hypothetical protein